MTTTVPPVRELDALGVRFKCSPRTLRRLAGRGCDVRDVGEVARYLALLRRPSPVMLGAVLQQLSESDEPNN